MRAALLCRLRAWLRAAGWRGAGAAPSTARVDQIAGSIAAVWLNPPST